MKKLLAVEGFIVIAFALAYIGLTFYSMTIWSDKSGEILIGFIIFAQQSLRGFFENLHRNNGTTATVTATPSPTETKP
jgi:hypothetical protein